MKNVILNFVDWYLENQDGEKSNYFEIYFKNDREIFIATLSEYAVEFAIVHGYNPFLVEEKAVVPFLSKLKSDLYKDGNSFYDYSQSKSSHMPRAILGNENYLKFLTELKEEKQK